MFVFVHAASAPEMGQDGALSNISFSCPASEAAAAFASSSNSFPLVATVMPMHSSQTFPPTQSVPPAVQWAEHQPAVTAESRQASAPPGNTAAYFPVAVHWFYCRNIELRQIWQPFSVMDSANLESAHQSLVSGKISRLPKNFQTLLRNIAATNGKIAVLRTLEIEVLKPD